MSGEDFNHWFGPILLGNAPTLSPRWLKIPDVSSETTNGSGSHCLGWTYTTAAHVSSLQFWRPLIRLSRTAFRESGRDLNRQRFAPARHYPFRGPEGLSFSLLPIKSEQDEHLSGLLPLLWFTAFTRQLPNQRLRLACPRPAPKMSCHSGSTSGSSKGLYASVASVPLQTSLHGEAAGLVNGDSHRRSPPVFPWPGEGDPPRCPKRQAGS
jgi:hypothetical protein